MSDTDAPKHVFARELDALLRNSPLSTARITAVAQRHRIGYSTLRSWCTGVHLPRTPADNADLRAFLFAVAADPAPARRVLAFAIHASRCTVKPDRRRPATGPTHPATVDVLGACRQAGPDVLPLLSWLCASRCRDMAVEAVAAIAGRPVAVTRQELAELVRSGLVVRREPQRYAVPDGVRAVLDGHTADEREIRDAGARLAAFYGRAASAATRRLFPDLLEPAALPGASTPPFATDVAASNWLLAERDNLVAVTEAVHGRDRALDGALLDVLGAAQQVRPHPAFWAPLADTALRDAPAGESSARAAYAAGIAHGNSPATAAELFATATRQWASTDRQREHAAALQMLGTVEHALGRSERSVRHYTEALRIRRRLGEHRAQASTLVFLADACLDLDRPAAAEKHARAAIELAERTGYSAGTAGALGSLGRALLARGIPGEAEYQFVQQQALAQHLVFHSRTAIALVGRARVCNRLRRFDSALDLAEEAVPAALAASNIPAEIDAYNAAALAHRGRGRRGQAQALHGRALQLAEHIGYRHGRVAALDGLHRAGS